MCMSFFERENRKNAGGREEPLYPPPFILTSKDKGSLIPVQEMTLVTRGRGRARGEGKDGGGKGKLKSHQAF